MESEDRDRVAELERSVEHLRAIVEAARDGIVSGDARGKILSWNKAAENTFGVGAEEAIGKSLDAFIPGQFCASLREELEQFFKAGKSRIIGKTFELVGVKKDGKEFPLEISLSGWRSQEGPCFTAIVRDITWRTMVEEELKNAYAELKEAQAQLIQSEKLTALGRFSLGIAHEVKNPLGIILGGMEFLEGKLAPGDTEAQEALGMIQEAVQRADSIVRGLLQFARPSALKRQRTMAQQLLQESLPLFHYPLPLGKITIELLPLEKEDSLWIEVDKNLIQQVLLNLLLNAVEAMPLAGKITVKAYRTRQPALPSGESACVLEVQDTGEGIAPEDLPKVFEPFFTTKRDRKGTGLGLSISKRIVENHGGAIVLESQQGKGTVVKVVLPLA